MSVSGRIDQQRLRHLVRRIAADDREAFAELFDRCSEPVLGRVQAHVSDPHRITGILAGTFVEVWWLAGCRTGPDLDVMTWIGEIAARRVADSRPAPAWTGPPPGAESPGEPWTHGVAVELARLLQRRRCTRPRPRRITGRDIA